MATVTAVRLGGAPPQDVSAESRLHTWLAGVNSHVPGERDAAVTTIAPWSRRDMDGILTSVKRALSGQSICSDCSELTTADREPITSGFVKRAARLPADIAVLYKTESGYALPSDGRMTAAISDGQQVGISSGTIHWDVGRLLLDLVRPNPSRDDDVRLWYQATTAFLQEWNEYYELEPHLARALTLFPNDTTLLLDSGTLHEGYAEARVQNVHTEAAETPTMTLPGRTLMNAPAAPPSPSSATKAMPSIRSQADEWNEGERLFRRALAIDPAFGEARVRLAHLLGLRERHIEAASEAQRALAGPLPPVLKYYALLFLGRAQQALGQSDPAHVTFEQAVALYPGAQSPHLALSQLARDRGDHANALSELDVLSRPLTTAAREDPWWRYNKTHAPGADDLLAQLRAAVLR